MPMYQSFLEKIFDRYLNVEGASKKTRKNYQADIETFLQWLHREYHLELKHPQQLNILEANQLLRFLYEISQEKTTSSVVRFTSSFKAFLRALSTEGYMSEQKTNELFEVVKLPPESFNDKFSAWKWTLRSQGTAEETIQQSLHHLNEFHEWINSYQKDN